MRIPYTSPDPAGSERANAAKEFRDLATEVARLRPHAVTRPNGEEQDYPDTYLTNFTKGLAHDEAGLVAHVEDYRCFVEAINSPDRTLFEKQVETAVTRDDEIFHCEIQTSDGCEPPKWRGWESPRAGHVYDLEGPDAGAVAMAPAPRLCSSELVAEMAEVYAMALLRDVPFTVIAAGGDTQIGGGTSALSANQVVSELQKLPFYSGAASMRSSTPLQADASGLNAFERRRQDGRVGGGDIAGFALDNLFRGSTPGAQQGPYMSQFMLVGNNAMAGSTLGAGASATFGVKDGYIAYGNQVIDQRVVVHKEGLDYMTRWREWLDVQNGANFKGADQYESGRRFITTPRDLATYVHFDALYQAYLNACLVLLGLGAETSRGFPEPSLTGHRDAFATFGGPHILSLVTEVATRCLKAVRRQKFNYHRRARPETLGGRFTLADRLSQAKLTERVGAPAAECLRDAVAELELADQLYAAIKTHNAAQASAANANSNIQCKGKNPHPDNLLLAMAFPEGSPMHPAYGAGHATVAGGCVTMLKAFFEMFDNSGNEKELDLGTGADHYVPMADGSALVTGTGKVTIQGELDKLAANISIGRNFAGVHYYSDYYDSLRMGERIAVGILMEQAPTYGDEVETTFTSFDGDHVSIIGEAGSCPSLSVIDRDGTRVSSDDWWLRHTSGDEVVLDL